MRGKGVFGDCGKTAVAEMVRFGDYPRILSEGVSRSCGKLKRSFLNHQAAPDFLDVCHVKDTRVMLMLMAFGTRISP
jgi:hypothetical protein